MPKLLLNDHASYLCKKVNKNLNIMIRLSGRMKGTKERIALLDAFLMSSCSYCPTSWHFCGRSFETKMENLHERGAKIRYEWLWQKLPGTFNHNKLWCHDFVEAEEDCCFYVQMSEWPQSKIPLWHVLSKGRIVWILRWH